MHLYVYCVFTLYTVPLYNFLLTIALVCSNLVPPLHGTNRCYLGNDGIPNPGDTCDIGCKYDYDQIGSLTRMCTKDGIWDGRETTCVKRSGLKICM